MAREGKEILLIDLCERLPYEVKGLHREQVHELFTIDSREANNACIQVDGYDAWFPIETFKPYLRSMSSMTEEEKKEYDALYTYIKGCIDRKFKIDFSLATDWLNSHHFDFRGLIEKGLALEAPKDMYK